MSEAEVIKTLRKEVRGGAKFLYGVDGDVVCAAASILHAYDAKPITREAAIAALVGLGAEEAKVVSRAYIAGHELYSGTRVLILPDAERAL